MKVTVCFGAIKIIVPCGDGKSTIGELIEKSVQRYKKATGRGAEYWVHVHSLSSQNEGGILDVDDVVCDVVDDREKLTAHFDEQDPSRAHVVSNHFHGDGTSTCASSVGTASPINFSDMNHINNSNNKTHHMHHHHLGHTNNNGVLDEDNEMDVVVTGEESHSKLQVRRGSDPIINMSKPGMTDGGQNAVIDKNANTLPAKTNSSDKPRSRRGSRDELNSAFSRFGRDSARQSLSSAHPSMNKWTDAQQKAENNVNTERGPDVVTEGEMDADIDNIVLTNDGTPLGVHIISKIEHGDGSAFGIVVHQIEAGGRAARDGRLRPGDYIIQINGSDISLHTFNRAQEMLREAMRNPTVKLTVQRERHALSSDAILPTSAATTATSPRENGHLEITIPGKSPSGKVPPAIPVRSPTTSLSSPPATSGDKTPSKKLIAPTSARRIGRKLYIQLMKGPQGLGFSVTSRDNPTGGKNPIFIKNIMPKGAAISDGRLKPGDRLMEVNGIEMTGKSQSEAVSILRSVKLGGVVNLVVSRQDSPVKMVPRQLPEETAIEEQTSNANRTVLTFDIPLNDTGSAGLGVSVKGKSGATEDQETRDLGIFIKSVIHGGAASKDGRLRPNDQLLCINDTSLANMSNSEAMETLRLAMSHEKSPRSTISLVIARRNDQDGGGGHTNNLSKPTVSPSADRNVDSGLMSPSPIGKNDAGFSVGMVSNRQSEGQLEGHDLQNGGVPRGNEIVVRASVEPQAASSRASPGAKVTYPGDNEEHLYTRDRRSSGGQTLPSGGEEMVMMADSQTRLSHPPTSPGGPVSHLSIHGSPSARAPSPPQWLLDWEKNAQDGELSPLPDADKQFDRDSYARASFSERRQGGSLDAKQMAWYKKTRGEPTPKKQATDVSQKDVAASTSSLLRASSMDSLLDSKPSTSRTEEETAAKPMGPGLGMEKSSSLESLEVAVATVQQQHRDDFPGRPRPKVRRGRICNDSFRAAVDRSYQDTPLNGEVVSMYTVMEAEENGGYGISRMSSNGSGDGGGGGITSAGSMKKKKDKKEEKDAKGKGKASSTGFKGLFRFGKNRKSIGSENALKEKDKDGRGQTMSEVERLEQEELERRKARQQAKQEHEKIQEEIVKLREQQAQARQKEERQEAMGKSERMMQLRQQYQQRHRDRQGRYVDDDEEDDMDDDYAGVNPQDRAGRDRNGYEETMSQRERLEAARAEQRERDRQRHLEKGGDSGYERIPPEAEDRRKDRHDDIYSEARDKREERLQNHRYAEDPYADPRNLRNQDRSNRYYDDGRYGRREAEENPYERHNGKRELQAQDSREGRYDRRDSEPSRQERRRSLKRADRVEARGRPEDRPQGKENVEVERPEKRDGDEKERDRRPSRTDRSTERRNPRRDERQDARRDERYDARRDERYDGRRDERRDNRYEPKREERYYEKGAGDAGDKWQEERRDRQPRDDRYDRYPDQRDRYRTAQQADRQSYSSLDRPSRRPRGSKDPNYYSMSEEISGVGRPDGDYGRPQDYVRYSDHQQASRRTSYPNGPVPNHVPHSGGGGDGRYRRSKSQSDYLDEQPRRMRSTSEQLEEDYYHDSRRSVPSQSRKGHPRAMEVDSRAYDGYNDAARV